MSNSLVIVESPTKVKSISKYLGDGYTVMASVGHVRDLIEPKNLPAEQKHGSLGKFSVDVENGFQPYYAVSDAKKKTVTDLKRALKDADELILATDEDREGEAIAWHLMEVLKPKVPVKRMVFHEITQEAIEEAKGKTRDLDEHLVDAQETRRILDRLYGYEISPVLWRKVGPGLSAGRVQSAATRLIVDRERERLSFVAATYWGVDADLSAAGQGFGVRLTKLGGQRIATGRDFDDNGKLKNDALVLLEPAATTLEDALKTGEVKVTVASVESKPYTRRPAAPFTTSTLQQEASRKLHFSARQTMSVAQSLYENGHITYMRTDSSNLSTQAISAARKQASELYGADSIPDKPRYYGKNAKNAQEAHEAIRPAGSEFTRPRDLVGVGDQERKLYDLIWKRTVASQMADAKGQTATVTLNGSAVDLPDSAGTVSPTTSEYQVSGTVITFRGFLAAYEEGRDETREGNADGKEAKLPPLKEGELVAVEGAEAKSHETSPPPRYTEASLVKVLDELGIGRPSTYASIIATIMDRGYAKKRGNALVPGWTAFSVVRLLEEHFQELVEYDFTAQMESDLDHIASGEQDRTEWLGEFYFGSDDHPGLRKVIDNLGEIDARAINSTKLTDTATLRIGRYGPYIEVVDPNAAEDATPRRINIPEELAPDELTPEKVQELIDAPVVTDRVLGQDPETGHDIVVKDGRFGPYVSEVLPEPEPTGDAKPKRKAAAPKPRTASLFKSMLPETVTFDDAMKLLSLPRVVGVEEETGKEVTAQNGRYGPYLKKGTETRTLPDEDSIFTIDMPGAIELFSQPKYRGQQSKSVLLDFGEADPVSEKPVKLKDGRFGPYVTDGETNVTVPRGTDPMTITFARAVEMIAEKRAKGPAKKRTTTAKKPAAKKPAAKKTSTAKTTTAKKTTTAAKKPAARTTAAKTTAARTTAAKTTAANAAETEES
ncbi:type I DNA topoisomerase [Gulosibacter molinativorax]|uniref:DNA topoisomerase 1 n=1 Tax=Gulosibacter molinativorax TaxID=256821 RepID=A0ABT7CAZ4_9MICO|nr:type I DNA topoisomerase [Gulosibacter molinativorax]MDJ1372368.1 type I DNA topoisomerase [Gulosibacter molinativorax]QUY63543.1 DNA topoisomerase 1 [Gulosibacter molinativorax]